MVTFTDDAFMIASMIKINARVYARLTQVAKDLLCSNVLKICVNWLPLRHVLVTHGDRIITTTFKV